MSRLAGRVALVTGGARGIGRGIVERFLEEGASVMVADLDEDGSALDAELGEHSLYRRLDVTRADDWAAAFGALRERFGRVDILVNNAGTSRTGSIEDASEADWRFVMDTNALSVFLGCQQAVKAMRETGGAIVNIASARGQRTGAAQCAYSASKAAVLSLTESIALHCGEHGLPIRCNAICPGVIDTPLMRQHAATVAPDEPAAVVAKMTAMGIMGRLGTMREIGDAAVFLASGEASFVTGTALNVDGGFRIRDV
ncbi:MULTISPECIES: SDR family NAD(P)-dependent oxidoreductase [unclassified Sphingomonas]|uniref:SDR family NAD(P)-dependent oxidoreductase n=1 Tax=unclassified Sphingomonas TaxID=196159 RepID=UPI0006F7FAF4|nr:MULTISPECIES: glucose 1-dehydrogenase [unclassified Sphingomonas]KQX19562.1 short-chain dehydrogenase [Sphingomonas sp. Root1294]KQY65763.1 short-chain dehydrogenase [Sphingomonas sp. Root50]KRB94931.1 short-chain dehydrogenase [Sphingomonas sp. Root720]